VAQLRAVVVIVRHGLGQAVFEDQEWRTFALSNGLALLRLAGLAATDSVDLKDAERVQKNSRLGGGRALLDLISVMSRQDGRQDMANVPFVIWGHSAAASFARSFASEYPDRTVAVVSYQGNTRDVPVDVRAMARVPALVFAGEKDEQAGVENSLEFWRQGRQLNAPWAFVLEPGATHGSPAALKRSHSVTLPWLQEIVARRLATDGRLRDLAIGGGWHVDHENLALFAPGEEPPSGRPVSWLPDEASVKSWRAIVGKQ
jgi:dienelactone hydrolase